MNLVEDFLREFFNKKNYKPFNTIHNQISTNFAFIGNFSYFAIFVDSEMNIEKEPYFIVINSKSKKRLYIKIYKPEYYKNSQFYFNKIELNNFIQWLNSSDIFYKKITNYQSICDTWNASNFENQIDLSHIKMPDYNLLIEKSSRD